MKRAARPALWVSVSVCVGVCVCVCVCVRARARVCVTNDNARLQSLPDGSISPRTITLFLLLSQ